MTPLVVDASAALAWILRSQSSVAAMAFLQRHDDSGFIAPYVFPWEVHNVLLGLLRRGALSPQAYDEARTDLEHLEIEVHSPFPEEDIRDLADGARALGLSLFDYAYLEYAASAGATLITRDTRLLKAARLHRIDCVDLIRGE